jgi:predicted transcriptional regulator
MSVTAEQVRAARAWLNWSQAELADHSKVGVSTIRSLEDGSRKPIANNAAAIRRALEEAGAAFLLQATEGKKAPAAVLGDERGDPVQKISNRGSGSAKHQGIGARAGRGKRSLGSNRQ